ncbi:MAG TPA: glycosyltransferase family 4 protein [Anaerolineales bacterium]|nr:glycosyltransferase family 4 protein [Anaerolineales bacterium]
MKIALLTEKYTPDLGGLAISSERFARSLSSAGHQVRVFSPMLSLPPSEKQTLASNGVGVTRFGAHKRVDDSLVDWSELITEEHTREPFDLLHAYFLPQAGFVAAYAGRYLSLPSVVSIRGNDIERAAFDSARFSHVMYALQNASAVTTNTNELAKKAKAFIDREIYITPNGVDTEHFKPMDRNPALVDTFNLQLPNLSIIGFVGELREKKGLKTLLSAYAQIQEQRSLALLIIGEVRKGDDKKVFDEFQMANPDAHIIVTGYIHPKDLPAYYSLIDIFIHPSLRDGMPNAVLEAMACEKAVIATPVGGMKDILEDGKNGVIVNVNDPSMLAEKVVELLEDPIKYASLGKYARELVVNKFTLEKELEANVEIYRNLGLKL